MAWQIRYAARNSGARSDNGEQIDGDTSRRRTPQSNGEEDVQGDRRPNQPQHPVPEVVAAIAALALQAAPRRERGEAAHNKEQGHDLAEPRTLRKPAQRRQGIAHADAGLVHADPHHEQMNRNNSKHAGDADEVHHQIAGCGNGASRSAPAQGGFAGVGPEGG